MFAQQPSSIIMSTEYGDLGSFIMSVFSQRRVQSLVFTVIPSGTSCRAKGYCIHHFGNQRMNKERKEEPVFCTTLRGTGDNVPRYRGDWTMCVLLLARSPALHLSGGSLDAAGDSNPPIVSVGRKRTISKCHTFFFLSFLSISIWSIDWPASIAERGSMD